MEQKIKSLKEKKEKYLSEKIFRVPEKVKEREGKIEIFLARNHKQELIEKLKKQIESLFESEKKIEIKIDKNLIGGLRIKTKNRLFKGSIKDFLEKIRCQFSKS